ncbi:bifunctional alpha/beta hydrolase/OsmC family protein [Sedimentitalea todarodis]|uniref:Bifunctional alpha/beta hydrolase/OsmC family protein n=1 Tax=Sedimentitalea todarodis TaxID=1631240 RepID=A0ABU3VBM2_9RHOB|nr:bifunctional alpha/beta hydrolase/OsmC family protein [Sedimentitalea todarodis]MDU9003573.1 bifunctional alpha/beta hydrolase/OsmC family protein [Sedimentitalea todarodis]
MPTERITFPGHNGDELAARLDLPDGPVLATALFAHCFTCGKDIPAARRIAQRLASMGIAVLRFDFTGLGHSDGEFANTSFSSNVQDLVAAARWLKARDMSPDMLIGHSLGGAAVLKSVCSIKGIKAVVTLGAPFDPGHVTHNFAGSLSEIQQKGSADVTLGGRPFTISKAFVDDVSAEQLAPAISSLRAALLVMHAPGDDTVGIENASQIFLAAKHPKSFVTLDDADHMISRAEDSDYAADVIAAWLTRYVDLSAPSTPDDPPEGIVRVSEADPDGFLQDVQSGPEIHLYADEPKSFGGTNRGLSPYGLLAAGLGACTSMTIRMYARRKGWPLRHVTVDISHDKVHAQDAETGQSNRIDTFVRTVGLDGDLEESQLQRLLEIADKCPVHQTLEHGARVETRRRTD